MPGHRLVLVRHGKAEKGTGVDDHERDLTERGRRDSVALGRWLAASGAVPDLALVSDAVRARATWEHVVQGIGPTLVALEVSYEPALYSADDDALLDVVRECDPEVETLALVGHNPAMEEAAQAVDDGTGDADARAALHEGLSTAGVALFEVDGDWADVGPGTARLVALSAPRG